MNLQTYSQTTNTVRKNKSFIFHIFSFISTPQSTTESVYLQAKKEKNQDLTHWTKEFISKYRKDFEALSKK